MDQKRIVGWLLILMACLLGALSALAQGRETARRARAALAKLGAFDATYEAQSAGGRAYTIRVRFLPPDKMRVDVEPLGVMTLFDGERYLYLDNEQKRAIGFSVDAVQAELRDQQRRLAEIEWAGLPQPDAAGAPVYPSFVLGLSPDNLDVAVEMSSAPHQHGWIRELAIAEPVSTIADRAEFPTRASRGRVRLTVNLETGLLVLAEIGDPDDAVGTIRLKELKKSAPDAKSFEYFLPSTLEIRDQKSDPTLLQQLLLSAYRGHLDRLLETAKIKWSQLNAAQKYQLDKAIYENFRHLFALGKAQARQGVQQSLHATQFTKMIRDAATNAATKQKFAADHPELVGADLDGAWNKQVQTESTQVVLLEIVRAIDEQFVSPLRQQALDTTIGMEDAARKDLLHAATEPVFRAYLDLIRPIVEETITELLK